MLVTVAEEHVIANQENIKTIKRTTMLKLRCLLGFLVKYPSSHIRKMKKANRIAIE